VFVQNDAMLGAVLLSMGMATGTTLVIFAAHCLKCAVSARVCQLVYVCVCVWQVCA